MFLELILFPYNLSLIKTYEIINNTIVIFQFINIKTRAEIIDNPVNTLNA